MRPPFPGYQQDWKQKESRMKKELYVGNLSYDATEDDLRRVFAVAGTVTSVHIIVDKDTGASKGCAYVRMANEEELAEAIDCLDGALVGDRIMTVSIARPQKPQVPPFKGQRGKPAGSGRFGKDRK
jgi:RNA recognition motif-containing protein